MIALAVILLAMVILFTAGWYLLPSGWLTVITTNIGIAAGVSYEVVLPRWIEIKTLMPAEYAIYALMALLVLAAVARFRSYAQRPPE